MKDELYHEAETYANEFCSNNPELIEQYWDIVYEAFVEGAQWQKAKHLTFS